MMVGILPGNRIALVIILCFFSLAPTAGAAENPVPVLASVDLSLRTYIGFNGFYSESNRLPIIFVIENSGTDLSGELELIIPLEEDDEKERSGLTFSRNLELSRGSRKRLFFVVPPLSDEIIVKIFRGDILLAEEVIPVSVRKLTGRLWLCLSRSPSFDFLYSSISGKSEGPRSVRLVYPHPETLPDRWYGYEAVDCIIIDDAPLKDLNPGQLQALADWVAAGGTLFLNGGAVLKRGSGVIKQLSGSIGDILPVRPVGIKVQGDLGSFGEFPEMTPRPGGTVLLVESVLVSGEVLLRQGTTPLLVQGKYGLGTVFFSAIDISDRAFSGWEGLHFFLSAITDTVGDADNAPVMKADFYTQDLLYSGLISKMLRPSLFSFPPRGVVLAILIVFTLLIIWAGYLFNRKISPLKPVALLVTIGLCGTLGVWLFFSRIVPPDTDLLVRAQAETVFPGALKSHIVDNVFYMTSGPSQIDLKYTDHDVLIVPELKNGSKIIEDGGSMFRGAGIASWSYNSFEGHFLHQNALLGLTSFERDGVVFTVANTSARRFIDTYWYNGIELLPAGGLGPGEMAGTRFELSDLSALAENTVPGEPFTLSRTGVFSEVEAIFLESLLNGQGPERQITGKPLFIARSEFPVGELESSRKFKNTHSTVFTIVVFPDAVYE
jgi:hypothetical protein